MGQSRMQISATIGFNFGANQQSWYYRTAFRCLFQDECGVITVYNHAIKDYNMA